MRRAPNPRGEGAKLRDEIPPVARALLEEAGESVRRLASSRPGRVKALEQIVCVLINLCESGFKPQDVRTLARGYPQTRGLEDRVASRDHGVVEQHGPGFRAECWRVGVALKFLRLREERARPEPICMDFLHTSFGH